MENSVEEDETGQRKYFPVWQESMPCFPIPRPNSPEISKILFISRVQPIQRPPVPPPGVRQNVDDLEQWAQSQRAAQQAEVSHGPEHHQHRLS